MKKIQGTPKTIRELFTGVKYKIHYYQREYQWKRKQIEELVEDLVSEFYNNYKNNDELRDVQNYGNYFMGSVVLTEDDNAIIDGQQRLTSITLLLFCLYHRINDADDKHEVLSLLFSKKAGEKSFNINVEERNPCLLAIKNGDEEFDFTNHSESVKFIWERWKDLNELLDEKLNPTHVLHFKDWLIDNVDFIRILAQTEQDAHKIFVSMNDRGLSLTPTEMLKGYLLSEIADDEIRQEANSIWKTQILKLKEIDKDIESEFIKNWLRAQYANSIRERKRGAKAEDFENIGTTFHKWVREKHESIGLNSPSDYENLILNDFKKFSDLYIRLIHLSKNLTQGFEYIFYNANKKFTLQLQLLLAPMRSEDTNEEINKKLQITSLFLDIYLVRRIFSFTSIDYSVMYYNIFLLSKKIRGLDLVALKDVLIQELKSFEFNYDSIDKFHLNGWSKRFMLHIIARITHFIEEKSGMDTKFDTYVDRKIKNSYDIEHIWADHYSRHSDEFENEQAFDDFRDMFGDLLILPKDKNRSLNDNTYKEKIDQYMGENLLCKSLNQLCYDNHPNFKRFINENELDFKSYTEFTKESIKERQLLYKKICMIIWDQQLLENF